MLRARDYRARAREALKGNWGLAVGTGFAVEAISMALIYIVLFALVLTGLLSFNALAYLDENAFPSPIGALAYFILMILVNFVILAIGVGYYYFNINLVKGSDFRFENIFARVGKLFKIFGLFFMIGLFTFLWTLLFIIPGIIASFRYVMAPYIMAENPEIGIMEAISQSKEMMKGYKWKYFCLQISFLGWILLGMVTFFIGLLWVAPYIQAATAAFYLHVSRRNEQSGYDFNDE